MKSQRHENAPPGGLLRDLLLGLSLPHEGGHTTVETVVAKGCEVGVQLLDGALVFARLAGLDPQPVCEFVGKRIELARPIWDFELRLDSLGPKIFADRIPRQTGAPRNRPNGNLIPKRPAPDDTQQRHVDHSMPPAVRSRGRFEHGSILSGNFQPTRVRSRWKSTNPALISNLTFLNIVLFLCAAFYYI
jgi:hypothetical protein